ncbi:MAG: hypothetical protein M0026_18865 [Nocardiopsaceae bacterium]|nr:hypothetical protein [Nocardiopsaceae bacterium]
MIDPLPKHPYFSGTRVHDATEESVLAFVSGTAEVIDAEPQQDGTFIYLVKTDREGAKQRWPSYFTIPAGTWPGPPESDPLFGARPDDDGADNADSTAATASGRITGVTDTEKDTVTVADGGT